MNRVCNLIYNEAINIGKEYAKSYIMECEIRIPMYTLGYNAALKLLKSINPKLYKAVSYRAVNPFSNQLNTRSKSISILNKPFVVHIDKSNFMIWRKQIEYMKDSEGYNDKAENLSIIFLGPNRKKNIKIFNKKLANKSKESNALSYYSPTRVNIFNKRPMNSIIMDTDEKETLMKLIHNWSKDKKFYDKHGLTHKIGILLYGDPGTGKSSVAKAIASELSCNIYSHNVIDRYCNAELGSAAICLIEDIDLLFRERSRNDRDTNESLNGLFQKLDGLESTNDTIYIATTNNIDDLDPALIRSGRFDIKIRMHNFEKEDAIKFVKNLGYNESILDKLNIEYPVQPAHLQELIIKDRISNY